MNRSRTLLALAGMTLMTAMVGSAGPTAAYAQDFQAQGSHLNDPANARNHHAQRDPKHSHVKDPATARNQYDQQDPKNSRLNDPANARNIIDSAERRDPADARGVEDKSNKRDVK